MGGCDLCAFKEKPKVGAGINGTKEHRRSVGSRLLIWERCGRDAMRRARGRTARSKSGAWFFGTDNRALGGFCDVEDGTWSLYDRTCRAVFSRASLWPVMADRL
jgi:hypothetical protein